MPVYVIICVFTIYYYNKLMITDIVFISQNVYLIHIPMHCADISALYFKPLGKQQLPFGPVKRMFKINKLINYKMITTAISSSISIL